MIDCHYFPPGLWLPTQPHRITAHRPVPNYTAWWQRLVRPCALPCWDSPQWQGPHYLYNTDCCSLADACWESPPVRGSHINTGCSNSPVPSVHQALLLSCQESVRPCPGSTWPSGCRWSPQGWPANTDLTSSHADVHLEVTENSRDHPTMTLQHDGKLVS